MKDKFNYWIIPITFFIIGFFVQFWILSLANASFEFKIDDDTKEAINKISEFNNTLIINNNNYDAQYSCVKGCEMMHYNIVGYSGASGQQGKDNIYYYKEDCIRLCEDLT